MLKKGILEELVNQGYPLLILLFFETHRKSHFKSALSLTPLSSDERIEELHCP
jgi:hypothetical protein